jgi:L-fuculose-phosphate aldolase
MTSTEGTVSARLDPASIVITLYGLDRRYLEIENLVLIQEGQSEAGKQPSRSAHLHQVIYARHPDVQCIITAQSPNAMAYTVTGQPLDSKTIPESYVVLRTVPLIPHGKQYDAPEQIAAAISRNSPVLLIENDTVLATGASVHQAFDRLEVADFTALAMINTQPIGALVPIGEAEVRELEEEFG